MAPPRQMISTEQKGCTACETPFDDMEIAGDLQLAAVKRIVVWHGSSINSLIVYYSGRESKAVQRGGGGNKADDIILSRGEFITEIEGSVYDCIVYSLKFVTNKRTFGPFGQPRTGSECFLWKQTDSSGSPMQFLYFSGRFSAQQIQGLKATFAEARGKVPTSLLRFENLRDATTEKPATLSRFARNLISPPITLRIGPAAVTFHVAEEILYRLPFFKAALTGQFRESAEHSITMPEDSPDVMAALIEYLYNDVYTYTYDTENTIDEPISDLKQGEFHVSLYAVASKYDCQPLVDGAVRNFMTVLESLDDQDCLRLWKAAYANDLPISKWGITEAGCGFVNGLAGQLENLYENHGEELTRVFEEYPTLATDVLRVVVTKGI